MYTTNAKVPKVIYEVEQSTKLMSKVPTPATLSKDEYLELPPHERGHYLREVIKKTLKKNPEGVTVSDLVDSLPFDRRSVEKHLEVLTHTNIAYTSKVGHTTVYHPNGRTMHPGLEYGFSIKSRDYGIYSVENKLGEFMLVQEKKERDVGGGILIAKSEFDDFIGHLQNVKEEIKNE